MSEPPAHSRAALRQAYADAWRKHVSGAPLVPQEALLVDVLGWHPEYHALMDAADAARDFEPVDGAVAENPFLHLGLHVAVREQLAIDRPPGVRELQRRLEADLGDPHRAQHALMEALAETLWEAQRTGSAPDEARYIALARRRLAAAQR